MYEYVDTDHRPRVLKKNLTAIFLQPVTRSSSRLVLGQGFGVGGSNDATSGWAEFRRIQDAGRPPS